MTKNNAELETKWKKTTLKNLEKTIRRGRKRSIKASDDDDDDDDQIVSLNIFIRIEYGYMQLLMKQATLL